MARLKGQTLTVSATVAVVAFGDPLRHYTLVNDGSYTAFYRYKPNESTALTGTEAEIRALETGELKSGEAVVLEPPVPAIEIIRGSDAGGNTSVRVLPGIMVDNTTIALEGDLDIGNIHLLDIAGSKINPAEEGSLNPADCTMEDEQLSTDAWAELFTWPAGSRFAHLFGQTNPVYVKQASSAPSTDGGAVLLANGSLKIYPAGKTKVYIISVGAGSHGTVTGIVYHD